MEFVVTLVVMLVIGVGIGMLIAPRVEVIEQHLPPTFHCQHPGCDKYMLLVPTFKKGKHTGHSQYYCPDGHTGTPNCK